MKTGIQIIEEERQRQIDVEGWTDEHDDQHINGELSNAAACYSAGAHVFIHTHDGDGQDLGYDNVWPWILCMVEAM